MPRRKPIPEFPERRRVWPGRKDTKRWCKGVVGREHVWKRVPWSGTAWLRKQNPYVIDECENCKKQVKLRSASK
jgi:hypothetical protein